MADYVKIARRAATLAAAKSQRSALKNRTVELWSDNLGKLFIVADDEDAELAVTRWKLQRGEVWTGAEIELIARIADPEARREIAQFKRTLSGTVAGAPEKGLNSIESRGK